MQGRSLKNGEVTQEISDLSRTYRLLGSDKYVSKSCIFIIQILAALAIKKYIVKMPLNLEILL